ncbi:methyltransferase domain-containing protein [Roseateles microcysteis]|uniref:methyltransferase domain-containing protein n=1 Tax=Roseateles microcysteis TaxID=3119057 RepID=UPI002FE5B33A
MTPLHLCILQSAGDIHALGFLDQARYLRYQFRRLGAEVSLAKNRLRQDAINIVFGAHLGFDAELCRRYRCAFLNLEQLGEGGAAVSADYIELLRQSCVLDYDADNRAAYGQDQAPLLPLLYSPYLAVAEAVPLEQRPIDLLFFGVLNERRSRMLAQIEAAGVNVAQFDAPLYGPERDDYIRLSKAVFNAHFYASSRFEQTRVAHCLSLGTPVIAERGPETRPHAAFEDAVHWVNEETLAEFFTQDFGSAEFFKRSRDHLQRFKSADPQASYAQALQHLQKALPGRNVEVWQPTWLNLGSGKDYKTGWLNLDILESAQPDLVLDLARPLELPLRARSPLAGELQLAAGQIELIYANNVLEHVPDLPALMGNLLKLLCLGGEIEIEVPYERASSAWQDPTHVRAMNENSWRYYCDWFWYLGWFEHRFDLIEFTWLDDNIQACEQPSAAFMRVVLRKVETTPHERNKVRMLRADFGGLPDDPVDS